MMACGLPVIDLDYEDNWTNYESRENIMLVDTLPEKIAEGIEKILQDKKLQEKLSHNGLELVKSFPNEEETARRIESLILKEFNL
jgi:glycosyltransferase involved in cell wall biosynthesis